ncbi:MAG TPA: tRNA 2-thiouridine(34) synthase MnmA [Candidatus Paceibacterota bacterium]|nr:tRNA 2-thiouridine(34) synthase MnmA [Candidatus Paceibacterota bacterium]
MNRFVNSALLGKRIFIGLSGGVDSAVTAALLKEAGADIAGVFIQGWYPPGMPCTWREDRRDAMRVAARLGIPFATLDASAEYKRAVIHYLLSEYREGRTPNPDVMCNREVKFGAFYRFAKEHGADLIATGHYARALKGQLFRGVDETKDQSYFLWAVPQEALLRTIFPLGEMRKDETRALARRHRLPNAGKRDSQGICFLGSISVDDFLRAEFGEETGAVLDTDGKEIGQHDGALLHTIGQRLPLPDGPWYVVRKDIERNALIVSRERHRASVGCMIKLSSANWLAAPGEGETLHAQYRYHGPVIVGRLAADGDAFISEGDLPEELAEGQSLVVYRGEECLGGGIIG